MEMSADFSPCGTYRYRLTRIWGNGPNLCAIGLNPSIADDKRNDPTITRLINFAKDWNFGGLVMTNLLAYRSTDPKALQGLDDPRGPDNDDWIVGCVAEAGMTLAAWGANPMGEWAASHLLLKIPYDQKLWCLGLTKGGHPRHPLYVKRDTGPVIYLDRVAADAAREAALDSRSMT